MKPSVVDSLGTLSFSKHGFNELSKIKHVHSPTSMGNACLSMCIREVGTIQTVQTFPSLQKVVADSAALRTSPWR